MEKKINTNIRRGDTVMVVSGKDRGKKGKVLMVNPEDNSCIVDGVNVVIKHKKARSAQQKSAREKKAGAIDISNVMILCKCGKPTRISTKVIGDKRVRYCKKCDEVLDRKYVKVKEEKKKEINEEKEEKKVDKKPLVRREVKATADSKVKAPAKAQGSSSVALPRKTGGS
ncbi:MAG: 50S ribosomal protein L24 [Firmicutes bacterium]|nr:50S ribosomal protein L24 [Bacillota bacterium]